MFGRVGVGCDEEGERRRGIGEKREERPSSLYESFDGNEKQNVRGEKGDDEENGETRRE